MIFAYRSNQIFSSYLILYCIFLDTMASNKPKNVWKELTIPLKNLPSTTVDKYKMTNPVKKNKVDYVDVFSQFLAEQCSQPDYQKFKGNNRTRPYVKPRVADTPTQPQPQSQPPIKATMHSVGTSTMKPVMTNTTTTVMLNIERVRIEDTSQQISANTRRRSPQKSNAMSTNRSKLG